MSRQPIGPIDGDKYRHHLQKILDMGGNLPAYSYRVGIHHGIERAIKVIESGEFTIPADQGESTMLREALEGVRRIIQSAADYKEWEKVRSVLVSAEWACDESLSSSHREELREQIQLIYKNPYTWGEEAYRKGICDTIKLLGITIPGITEERG